MNRYAKTASLLAVLTIVGQVWPVTVNTNGEKGVVRTLSAKTMGQATLNVGAGISFGQSSDYVDGLVLSDGIVDEVRDEKGQSIRIREPGRMISANTFLALGLLPFWDIAASLPAYYDWAGFADVQDGGLGDLEISTKLLLPLGSKRVFNQGYYFSATAPVGMRNSGLFPRHPYYLESNNALDTNPARTFYSSQYPTLKGLMLWTIDIGAGAPRVPIQLHLNIGGVVNLSSEALRNTAIGSFAIEYSPSDVVTLFVDFHGESRWSNFSTTFDPLSDPFVASPGIRIKTPNGVFLHIAGDLSMSSRSANDRMNWSPDKGRGAGFQYSTAPIPSWGAQFQIGWNGFLSAQDDDRDGIKNDEDRCPKDPEDLDNFEDADGCPEPDNDLDGVLDSKDKCVNDAEDKDGFKDEDGCPDPDNDGDGIPDIKDQCPNVAEDFDGFADSDGCPDPDNDNDGVPDSADKCPNDVEDFDNFEDNDGCPDIDNDKDGIPDLKDKCPNEPETFNNFDDKDGCPDSVKKEPDIPKHQILRGVSFRSGSPEMTFDSYTFLDPVIKALKEYPEVEIEIRGHTDSVGDYAKNLQLSQMRAESVRQYLISKGINADRVRAVGFGSSSPIADNKSAAGRAQNRRIEAVRIK